MTDETILQILGVAASKEEKNNAMRASGVALDRLHKAAIWEDDAQHLGCHAFIDLDGLLKQSGSFSLETWMTQMEGLLEELFGEGVECFLTPVIYDLAEEGRRMDLQVSFDGISVSDAKSVLQGIYHKLPEEHYIPAPIEQAEVLPFPTMQ